MCRHWTTHGLLFLLLSSDWELRPAKPLKSVFLLILTTWLLFRARAWSTPCRTVSSWSRPKFCWPSEPSPSQTTWGIQINLMLGWFSSAIPSQLWDFPCPDWTPYDAVPSGILHNWVVGFNKISFPITYPWSGACLFTKTSFLSPSMSAT